MPFIARQEHFVCGNCGVEVAPLPHGSYRNHCPKCLWSKHVDDVGPGDRASLCQGLMEPVAVEGTASTGWILLHRCVKCGKQMRNKAAADDDVIGLSQRLSDKLNY